MFLGLIERDVAFLAGVSLWRSCVSTLDFLSLEVFCFALEGIAVITVHYLREAR